MKVIGKVIVGSRLHGLDNENSDTDIRGIHMHSLLETLSPFRKIKNTQWVEGDEDNTSYELIDFCKFAAQGNPSILEVLYSNMVTHDSAIFQELRENKARFLNSERIYEAAKGYAHNQYKKMNLFEPDNRTPKFCVAYIRALHQSAQLLRTGTMDCQITGKLKDELLEIKHSFTSFPKERLTQLFEQKMQELNVAYCENNDKWKPDIEWIEHFLLKHYKNF